MNFSTQLLIMLVINGLCALIYLLGRGKIKALYLPSPHAVFYFALISLVFSYPYIEKPYWHHAVLGLLMFLPCYTLLHILGRDKLREAYANAPEYLQRMQLCEQQLEDANKEIDYLKAKVYEQQQYIIRQDSVIRDAGAVSPGSKVNIDVDYPFEE